MARRRNRKSDAYTVHNKVRIIRGGADYFDCIEQIADNAVYSLHFQTYIFDEDETGTRVAEALIRAAKRKVLVYLLLDGYASQHLSPKFVEMLRKGGVRFAYFSPFIVGNFYYMGRRLHHKVLVADSSVCLVAGINVSNRYNDIGNVKAWLDWAVMVEGEVARGINDICTRVWNRSVFRRNCRIKSQQPVLPEENCLVRVRRNDWVYKRTQITRTYRELFQFAQSDVIVMTSYFWPPQKLLRRMAFAARRGVRIRLILTQKADVPLAKYTERYLYSWLFRNKIEVYEYRANVLHGKIAVCDKQWLTVGSYNVNNISAFASVELNLDIKNEEVATEAYDKLLAIIDNDCVQITEKEFRIASNLLIRLFYYLSYRVTHMIFYIFTFYFTQKNGRD